MSIMNNNKSSNSSNNNNDDDTQSNTESANIGEETVVQLEEEEMIKKPTSCGKSCCKTILLLCAVILLSFFTSVVTTKYVLNALPTEIDDAGTSQQRRHADQLIPVSEKQIQDRPIPPSRVGAQLSIDQDRLQGSSTLVWTHDGADDYLDGIDHVTQHHGNAQFDCLEAKQNGRYLISIQLTYHYSFTSPQHMVKSYFTLTRFRNDEPCLVAKSDHVVPPRNLRVKTITKQPVTMVRSDQLRKGDRLCVTASNPKLIYASKIDNFFGMVAL